MENDAEFHVNEPLDASPGDDSIPLARPISCESLAEAAPEFHLMGQSRSAALGDILLFVFLLVSLEFGGEYLIVGVQRWTDGGAAAAAASPAERIDKALLIPVLAWRTALAVLIIGAIVRYRGGGARSVGVTSRNLPLDLLIALGTAMTSGLVIGILMLTLATLSPAFAAQLQENSTRIMDRVPRVSPAAFVLVTLLIGINEELMFRGFLLPRLRRATGSWTIAVLLSTAVFATLHLIDQVAAALVLVTVLSLMFSLVTIWRRSILPAIVAHAVFDFGMFIQLYYLAGDQWK